MKPIDELNRTPVLVLYWGLFGGVGNCGVGEGCVRSLRDGLKQCAAVGKRKDGVPGRAQVVSRRGAGGVVEEWAHTSGEPCLEGSASALVTAAGKVMKCPSGGSDRAAESRCEPWFRSRTRDTAAGSCRSGPHKNPGNPGEREAGPPGELLAVVGRAAASPSGGSWPASQSSGCAESRAAAHVAGSGG
jgi:hypothetical protein